MSNYSKKDYRGIIAVDFDAVISTYIRPWKFDTFGEPVKEIVEFMREFQMRGYYMMVFTKRVDTPNFRRWLQVNGIPYDGLNQNICRHPSSHFKPSYDLIIDDKGLNFHFDLNKKTTETLIEEAEKILKWGREGK